MFKGRPVAYQPLGKDEGKEVPVIQNPDNSLAKIWFPDGAPAYTPDTEAADPSVYNDATVQHQWKAFMDTGTFAGGLMPEVPPKREFCAWNF
jgi:nucleoporin NUP42